MQRLGVMPIGPICYHPRQPGPPTPERVKQDQPPQGSRGTARTAFHGSESSKFCSKEMQIVRQRHLRPANLGNHGVVPRHPQPRQREEDCHVHGGAGARAQAELQALPGAPGANTRLPPVFRLRDPLERERQVRRQRPQRRTGLAAAPRRHRLTLTAQVVHLSDP